MNSQKKVLRFVNPLRKKGTSSDIGVNALHQTAMRLADINSGRSRFKTKDLVGLLLCHGARLSRSSMPLPPCLASGAISSTPNS